MKAPVTEVFPGFSLNCWNPSERWVLFSQIQEGICIFFLWPHLWHVEIPRGKGSLDPLMHCSRPGSNPHICSNPSHCSQILNPLWHSGNSGICIFFYQEVVGGLLQNQANLCPTPLGLVWLFLLVPDSWFLAVLLSPARNVSGVPVTGMQAAVAQLYALWQPECTLWFMGLFTQRSADSLIPWSHALSGGPEREAQPKEQRETCEIPKRSDTLIQDFFSILSSTRVS